MNIKTLFALILIFGSVAFAGQSHAQAQVTCTPYEDAQLAVPDTNIESTNLGALLAQTTAITFITVGNNSCDVFVETTECVTKANETGDATNLTECDLAPVASSNSTVLGMTSTARAFANGDVVPVNFAYFFRDQVKNVPIIGEKVYAQDTYNDIYGAEIALAIWKTFRNMALGLMSIFLIVIGIMIILRKKADPRTVLTLQAALPKVIISMVLIVFSFAIGALFIRFIPALRSMANTIVTSVTDDLTIEDTSSPETVFAVSAFAIVGIIGAFATGTGVAIGTMAAFVGPILALVWLIVLIMVYLKTVIIYVRLLIHTVTAPFQFAFGAIPGNDAMIMNWFKKMLAWVLSIPAMYFLVEIAEFVQIYAIQSTLFGFSVSGFEGTFMAGIIQSGLQQLFLLLISPFISIMLLVTALSAPKKIEAMILGEPKRK